MISILKRLKRNGIAHHSLLLSFDMLFGAGEATLKHIAVFTFFRFLGIVSRDPFAVFPFHNPSGRFRPGQPAPCVGTRRGLYGSVFLLNFRFLSPPIHPDLHGGEARGFFVTLQCPSVQSELGIANIDVRLLPCGQVIPSLRRDRHISDEWRLYSSVPPSMLGGWGQRN